MQDIIPIFTSNFNGKQLNSIDARKLHEFLEVKSKFATWIQNRIQKYKFKENIDFISVSIFLENGGRTIEYHLSTNMAKQLTMVENNEKGEQARDYFIQKEEQANNQIQTPAIDSKFLLQIAQQMEEKEKLIELQSEKITVLEIETREQQNKIEEKDEENQKLNKLIKDYFKEVKLFTRHQVANFLKSRGLNVKEYEITEYLNKKNWLCKGEKNKQKATATSCFKKEFVNDLIPYTDNNGVKKVNEYGKFTVDGLVAIANYFVDLKK